MRSFVKLINNKLVHLWWCLLTVPTDKNEHQPICQAHARVICIALVVRVANSHLKLAIARGAPRYFRPTPIHVFIPCNKKNLTHN